MKLVIEFDTADRDDVETVRDMADRMLARMDRPGQVKCWLPNGVSIEENKLAAIKAVRGYTDLGLKEAKYMVEDMRPGGVGSGPRTFKARTDNATPRHKFVAEMRNLGYEVE